MITVVKGRVVPYTFDLGAPLATARGRVRYRRGWLVALESSGGALGWGDAASFAGFGSSDEKIGCRLGEWLGGAVAHLAVESLEAIAGWLERNDAVEPEVRAAVELALLDLLGQARALPIATLLDPAAEAFARTHLLVTSISPELARSGAHTFKLKVGRDLDDDERRVAELRAAIGPDAAIRLDAGGGYSKDTARRAIARLSRYRIELIEQPIARGHLPALALLRRVAADHGMKLAVDEEIDGRESLEAVVRAHAADAIVLKPMFAGGLLAARRLAAYARGAGLDVIVTHALESAIGRTGALHLAAALPGTHGLAFTPAEDLAEFPVRMGDSIALPARPGLGVVPERNMELSGSPLPEGEGVSLRRAIPHPLQSSALARPDHLAAILGDRTVSYGTLAALAARGATALRGRGVHAGMNIALDGPPSLEWLAWFHAIGWAGAAVCPLPPRATAHEKTALLAALHADAVIDASEPIDERSAPLPEPWWPLDQTRLVIATSGTSGRPRLIPLSTAQLCFSAFGSSLRLGHDPADRWLCALPLHHIAGASIVMRAAIAATTVVFHEQFDAARVAAAHDPGEVSVTSCSPTFLAHALESRPARPFPARLRALLIGGGPASDELILRCRSIAAPLALSWGMTETASQIATRSPGDCAPLAAGLPPLPFARVSERAGRLTIHGPLAAGAIDTLDRGAVDLTTGRVLLFGRADATIVHGGVNIDPAEIEAALADHPAVAEVAVIGLPCARQGQIVVAALAAKREPASDAAIRAHARQRLAGYKLPQRFVWLDALPRTALGKIARAELTTLLAEHTDPAKALEQQCGRATGAEVGQVHEGVNMPSGGAKSAVGADQPVTELDRAAAELADRDRHVDAVVEPDGPAEVRLGVHQRHADLLGDQPVHVALGGDEQLLERRVAHLEYAAEKQDSRAIHLVETRGDAMNERHDHERR